MGVGNIFLLTQVTIYMLLFLFSFFIFIPMIVNISQFNGHCLLFADGKWIQNNNSDPLLTDMQWGDRGFCNIVTFVGIVALPISLFYVMWLSVFLFKDIDLSWFGAFGTTVVCAVMVAFTFVAGIIATSGFNQWCSLLNQHVQCSSADYLTILKGADLSVGGSYIEFGMIQFGLWASFLGWVIVLGMASYNLHKYHTQENFFLRMIKERERLLGPSLRGQGGMYGQPSDPNA